MRFEGVDPLEKFLLVYRAVLALEQIRNRDSAHPNVCQLSSAVPYLRGQDSGWRFGPSTVAETLTFEGTVWGEDW